MSEAEEVERERFEERAAILEYLAGMPRREAEKEARRQIESDKQRRWILEAPDEPA